ncbi:MAG: CYTH domain-containing protein [Lentimonas sp.]|jgi:adenylate cyclase
MTNTMEIERKFLVHETPELERVMHQRLRQGYIATDSTEVRVRKAGDQCTLTCKRGSGLVRLEEEIGISQAQFHSLWSLTKDQRVDKTRYNIEFGTHVIELDIYHGALTPLVVAEVEFESESASNAFIAPDFFGLEVTEDKRYKNKNLALQGLPQ